MDSRRKASPAFTLIELLIVVAIIAILAAIAVPNFLEAQVRSKVSRAKSDMRSVATALEAYAVDHNEYPFFFDLIGLTTPVAYISSLFQDPFKPPPEDPSLPFAALLRIYGYGSAPIDNPSRWALQSNGPDTDLDIYLDAAGGTNFSVSSIALTFYPGYDPLLFSPTGFIPAEPGVTASYQYIRYDPTNGTVSSGDVFRLSDHQLD